MSWKPDAIVQMALLPTEEGGRESAISSEQFGCILVFPDGSMHDGRFDISVVGEIKPGQSANVPLKFLNFEAATHMLEVGTCLQLMEAELIGVATVVELRENA